MGALAVSAGVGAGLGLLKQAEQERQFKKDAELAATQTQLSGLQGSGIQAGQVGSAPSLFDNVSSGALSGAGFGQNLQKAKFQSTLQDKLEAATPNSVFSGGSAQKFE